MNDLSHMKKYQSTDWIEWMKLFDEVVEDTRNYSGEVNKKSIVRLLTDMHDRVIRFSKAYEADPPSAGIKFHSMFFVMFYGYLNEDGAKYTGNINDEAENVGRALEDLVKRCVDPDYVHTCLVRGNDFIGPFTNEVIRQGGGGKHLTAFMQKYREVRENLLILAFINLSGEQGLAKIK